MSKKTRRNRRRSKLATRRRFEKLEKRNLLTTLGFSGGYELQNWSKEAIDNGATSISPDSGPAEAATFGYDLNLVGGFERQQRLDFLSTAVDTGSVTFDYEFSGNSRFFEARAFFDTVSPNGAATVVDESTSGDFSFDGSATLISEVGEAIGFRIGGGNSDSNRDIFGDLTITNIVFHDAFVVDNNTDVDDGDFSLGNLSLREAVRLSNEIGGADRIIFEASLSGSTITLDGAELLVTESLTIDASALASPITLDAGGQSRVLNFGASTGDFGISNLTITGGATTGNEGGAGISFGSDGTLTVNGSTIRGNSSAEDGGGILVRGDLVLQDSVVSDNTSDRLGGGVIVFDGNATIVASSVTGNTTRFSTGGGIHFQGGAATITDSTISGNAAPLGGGIGVSSASLTLTNSTVSENTARSSILNGGGGIFHAFSSLPLVVQNSTIVRNTSNVTDGGGIVVADGSVQVENSIVAENTAAGSASDFQRNATGGTLTINHSLIGNADGLGTIDGNVGNLTGTEAAPLDPLLADLADNGGPTLTHALLPDSPAINAGDNALAVDADGNPLQFDQRGEGFSRVSVGVVDMGAFEADELASLVVSTDLDVVDSRDGVTSLREAIAFADSLPGEDTITFDASLGGETILLNGTELVINDSLVLDGSALSASVTLDADDQSRVLNFAASAGNLTIDRLTITGGVTTGTEDGAGINFLADGTLTVTNSVIRGNSSANSGGGIRIRDGELVLGQSDVIGNTAEEFGGGVITSSGNVTITASNITGNVAINGFGGGMHLQTVPHATIIDSTISQNSSGRGGGGINAPLSNLT
ncbi:MAG: right-handed parallel beta-helix repeat-containing protein, partial [Planctomycetota bacterium]